MTAIFLFWQSAQRRHRFEPPERTPKSAHRLSLAWWNALLVSR
ncbi:MAG: hypothetical protein ACRDJ3_07105 [Solirubrobacteraceae bacterium]